MAKCGICGQDVPQPELMKHKWDQHREEMLTQVANAHRKKKPNGSKPAVSGGGTFIATAEAPRPAAVVFTLGSSRIEIDPQKLYESYILYLDLKTKLGLKDDFSAVMLDAFGVIWKLLAAAPQPDGREVVKSNQLEVTIERSNG